MTKRGILKDPQDIYYLDREEFDDLVRVPFPSAKLKSTVEARKQHHKIWDKRLPAIYLYDDIEVDAIPADVTATEEELTMEENTAKGSPAVSGKTRAQARVIPSLDRLDEIRQGEILVTSNIDPGWTNVFPILAGLVTETGGLLSHGAILAREYGIPAIMGVSGATGQFQTGDMLEIDGTTGIIKKIDYD
jgi:pyruvate,water dikinase